ncbi:MAG: hypothetical protein JWN40_3843, partial [Phycisphaerales bacterium]|nr:hypothetical protein [Phycisphaerales bacterium]
PEAVAIMQDLRSMADAKAWLDHYRPFVKQTPLEAIQNGHKAMAEENATGAKGAERQRILDDMKATKKHHAKAVGVLASVLAAAKKWERDNNVPPIIGGTGKQNLLATRIRYYGHLQSFGNLENTTALYWIDGYAETFRDFVDSQVEQSCTMMV